MSEAPTQSLATTTKQLSLPDWLTGPMQNATNMAGQQANQPPNELYQSGLRNLTNATNAPTDTLNLNPALKQFQDTVGGNYLDQGPGGYDKNFNSGGYDQNYGAGAFNPRAGIGAHDPNYGAGGFTPNSWVGAHDQNYGSGQFDKNYGAGAFNPNYGSATYDSNYGTPGFNQSFNLAQQASANSIIPQVTSAFNSAGRMGGIAGQSELAGRLGDSFASQWGNLYNADQAREASLYDSERGREANLYDSERGRLAAMYGDERARDLSAYGTERSRVTDALSNERARDLAAYSTERGRVTDAISNERARDLSAYDSERSRDANLYNNERAREASYLDNERQRQLSALGMTGMLNDQSYAPTQRRLDNAATQIQAGLGEDARQTGKLDDYLRQLGAIAPNYATTTEDKPIFSQGGGAAETFGGILGGLGLLTGGAGGAGGLLDIIQKGGTQGKALLDLLGLTGGADLSGIPGGVTSIDPSDHLGDFGPVDAVSAAGTANTAAGLAGDYLGPGAATAPPPAPPPAAQTTPLPSTPTNPLTSQSIQTPSGLTSGLSPELVSSVLNVGASAPSVVGSGAGALSSLASPATVGNFAPEFIGAVSNAGAPAAALPGLGGGAGTVGAAAGGSAAPAFGTPGGLLGGAGGAALGAALPLALVAGGVAQGAAKRAKNKAKFSPTLESIKSAPIQTVPNLGTGRLIDASELNVGNVSGKYFIPSEGGHNNQGAYLGQSGQVSGIESVYSLARKEWGSLGTSGFESDLERAKILESQSSGDDAYSPQEVVATGTGEYGKTTYGTDTAPMQLAAINQKIQAAVPGTWERIKAEREWEEFMWGDSSAE